jgi:single-strand DNA-binding protein
MQQLTITGYLSRDAEMRSTQSGQTITNLNIPVKQGWGDKEQTNWYRVAVWGKRAEFAAKFRKGEFITVTGELTIGEYDGKPQYEINASDFHGVRPASRDGGTPAADYANKPADKPVDDLDDDIPFISSRANW